MNSHCYKKIQVYDWNLSMVFVHIYVNIGLQALTRSFYNTASLYLTELIEEWYCNKLWKPAYKTNRCKEVRVPLWTLTGVGISICVQVFSQVFKLFHCEILTGSNTQQQIHLIVNKYTKQDCLILFLYCNYLFTLVQKAINIYTMYMMNS